MAIDINDLRSALRDNPTVLDLSVDAEGVLVPFEIPTTDADIAAVVRLVEEEGIRGLHTVIIPTTHMTIASIPVLERMLVQQPDLTHLALHDNGYLGTEGARRVAGMLLNLNPLTSFDYHHCEAGTVGVAWILYALATKHRDTLTTLNVGNNVRAELWAPEIFNYFSHLSNLQDLCVIDSNLGANDAVPFGDVITNLPLKKLHLGANHFGDQGSIDLFSRIQRVVSELEVLVFDECGRLNMDAWTVVYNAIIKNIYFKKPSPHDRALFLGESLNPFCDDYLRIMHESIDSVNVLFNRMRSYPLGSSSAQYPLAYRGIYLSLTESSRQTITRLLIEERMKRYVEEKISDQVSQEVAGLNINQDAPAPADNNLDPAPT